MHRRSIADVDGELLVLHDPVSVRRQFLPPPPSEADCKRHVRALGFPPDHHLYDLVVALDGLRDWPPTDAGGLVPIAKTTTVARARRSNWVIRGIPADEIGDMRDAALVYEAGTGDILVSPRGPIAWARHDSQELEFAGRSLADFVAGWRTY